MRTYPLHPSFTAGQTVTLGVEPNSQFCIAFYRQGNDEALTLFGGVTLVATSQVQAAWVPSARRYVFKSAGSSAPMRYDDDWAWPTVTVRPSSPVSPVTTGAFVAVLYDVDDDARPTTDLGRRITENRPVFPHPPDSDNMALVIARPARPSARIAYVIAVATYHAYNSTGGGCFYEDYVHGLLPIWNVSLRRPGGGLGAQIGEPPDPYDLSSPRQQFAHWDAKFVRWLIAHGVDCDFYTDVDLHSGATLDLSRYACMLSVGHHEYWSQGMWDNVSAFIRSGGNVAAFSGNTNFRPVNFGVFGTPGYLAQVNKLAMHWDNYGESQLLGLSYRWAGGYWGIWDVALHKWTKTERKPYAYTVRQADHWSLAGTGLKNGDRFGGNDRLAGYEADGVPEPSNGFNVVALSDQLVGYQDFGGFAAIGTYGPETPSGPKRKLVFNAATTDWARILVDERAESHAIANRITTNVLTALSERRL